MEAFMEIWSMFIFGLILVLALLIPWYQGLLKKNSYIYIAVLALGLAFVLRGSQMNYQSGDYNTFLSKWVDYFRVSGFRGLSESVGNYNVPYLYFLALFSYLPLKDLYLIKLLSVFFDVVLAFGMMKLTSVFTRSAVAAVCAQAEGQGVRHWQQHAGPMAVQAWPSGNPHFVTDVDTPDDVRRLDAELGGGRLCWPEDGEAMPAQSGSSLSGMG